MNILINTIIAMIGMALTFYILYLIINYCCKSYRSKKYNTMYFFHNILTAETEPTVNDFIDRLDEQFKNWENNIKDNKVNKQ